MKKPTQELQNSIIVNGEQFDFQEPSQFTPKQFDISEKELEITLKTLDRVKKQTEN